MQERWEQHQAKRWGGVYETKGLSLTDKFIYAYAANEVRINHVHVLFEDTTSDEKHPTPLE